MTTHPPYCRPRRRCSFHDDPHPARARAIWAITPDCSTQSRACFPMDAGNYMSVPAFGDWDMKNGLPDYSMDFSKIREKRKMHKSDFSRASIGNEDELMANDKRTSTAPEHQLPNVALGSSAGHSPVARKRIVNYFICCMGA